MATVIRLARFGAKKRPYYHVVVTDSRNARNSGNILATVGKYDPMLPRDSEKRVILKIDEIKDWLAKGAKPSDRVYRFLANAGLVAARVVPNQTKKNQQSEKTLMKIKIGQNSRRTSRSRGRCQGGRRSASRRKRPGRGSACCRRNCTGCRIILQYYIPAKYAGI